MKASKATDQAKHAETLAKYVGSDNGCSLYTVCYDFKLPHDSREAARTFQLLRGSRIDAVTLTPFTVRVNGLFASLRLTDRAFHLTRQPFSLSRQSHQTFQSVVLHARSVRQLNCSLQ